MKNRNEVLESTINAALKNAGGSLNQERLFHGKIKSGLKTILNNNNQENNESKIMAIVDDSTYLVDQIGMRLLEEHNPEELTPYQWKKNGHDGNLLNKMRQNVKNILNEAHEKLIDDGKKFKVSQIGTKESFKGHWAVVYEESKRKGSDNQTAKKKGDATTEIAELIAGLDNDQIVAVLSGITMARQTAILKKMHSTKGWKVSTNTILTTSYFSDEKKALEKACKTANTSLNTILPLAV